MRTEGELTAGPRGYRFDVRRTAKYRFTLCEGQVATPGMRLCLLDLSGAELAADDGSCEGGGEISRNLDPGGYVIAVSGPPGAFTLTTALVPICDGRIVDVPLNTVLGMFVRPSLLQGEINEALAVGRRFSIVRTSRCVLSLCQEGGSASFDSRLCLFDQKGEVVAANDDHCGTSSEIDVVLDRGFYTIAVSGAPGARGDFSLAIFVVPECSGSALTRVGELTVAGRPQLLQGALAAGEAHGYFVDFGDHDFSEFSFCRNGGSAGFDSVLCLFDSFGEAVALNDDFCGVNAHLHVTQRGLAQGMVVITGRQSGGEYSLSYAGVKRCNPIADDFLFKGTLAPGLEALTVDGSVNGDRDDVWFVEVPSDGAYAFTFCEAPAIFEGFSPRMCLRDVAGQTIQEGQPCPDNASNRSEIRSPLAAGEYLLSIGEIGGGTNRFYKLVYYAESISPGPFRSCDFDCSGQVTITDPIATLGFLFLGAQAACCEQVADCNSSGAVEISDAVFALNFLFNGGQSPQFFLDCGGSGCVGYPCAGQ